MSQSQKICEKERNESVRKMGYSYKKKMEKWVLVRKMSYSQKNLKVSEGFWPTLNQTHAQVLTTRMALQNGLKLGEQTRGRPGSRLPAKEAIDRTLESVKRFLGTLDRTHAQVLTVRIAFQNGLKLGEQTRGKPASRLQEKEAIDRTLKSVRRFLAHFGSDA